MSENINISLKYGTACLPLHLLELLLFQNWLPYSTFPALSSPIGLLPTIVLKKIKIKFLRLYKVS